MTGTTGWRRVTVSEFTHGYRKLTNLSDSDVPVIFISAHYDAMNCRRATDAGAAAFFQKPFRASEFLTAIETAFKNRSDEPGDRRRSR